MPVVIDSLWRALQQLPEPEFRRPLVRGLIGAAIAFALLIWGADRVVGNLAGGSGWMAHLAGAASGILVLLSALWLFLPVAMAIAGVFLDEVAAAVEARFYPGIPPAAPASLWAQAIAGVSLGLKIALLSLVSLVFAILLPGFGWILSWAVASWGLGAGLFEAVAQRRLSGRDATRLRRQRALPVFCVGGVLAALALIPGVNLFVPMLGTAAMVHLLQLTSHRTNAAIPANTPAQQPPAPPPARGA